MTSVGVLTPTQSGSFDANTSRIYNFPSSHFGPCNNHSSTCNISSQYIFTFWPSEFNLICATLDFKPQLLIFSGLCMFFFKLVYCYSARLQYRLCGLLSTKSSEKWHNVKGMSTSTPLSLGKNTHQRNGQYLSPN